MPRDAAVARDEPGSAPGWQLEIALRPIVLHGNEPRVPDLGRDLVWQHPSSCLLCARVGSRQAMGHPILS